MSTKIIVVAGATGKLGGKIVLALLDKGAEVRALVRPGSDPLKKAHLEKIGAKVIVTELTDDLGISAACRGADCVVSALAGLRDAVVESQKPYWMVRF